MATAPAAVLSTAGEAAATEDWRWSAVCNSEKGRWSDTLVAGLVAMTVSTSWPSSIRQTDALLRLRVTIAQSERQQQVQIHRWSKI